MKLRTLVMIAAAVAALTCLSVSCSKDLGDKDGNGQIENENNENENNENGDQPAEENTGIYGCWQNTEEISSILHLQKIRISRDGTAEFLFVYNANLSEDNVLSYSYTLKGETLVIENEDERREITMKLNDDGQLCISLVDEGMFLTEYTLVRDNRSWEYHPSDIFTGMWESEDEYEKIYLNIAKVDYLRRAAAAFIIDGDYDYGSFMHESTTSTTYKIFDSFNPETVYLKFEDPYRDGEKLKCTHDGRSRVFIPMDSFRSDMGEIDNNSSGE